MYRILLVLLAVLTLWCGLSTWAVLHQRGKLATLGQNLKQSEAAVAAATAARKQADKALVSLRQKNAATARETASATASLHAATRAEPEWAEQAVPEGVRNALK